MVSPVGLWKKWEKGGRGLVEKMEAKVRLRAEESRLWRDELKKQWTSPPGAHTYQADVETVHGIIEG